MCGSYHFSRAGSNGAGIRVDDSGLSLPFFFFSFLLFSATACATGYLSYRQVYLIVNDITGLELMGRDRDNTTITEVAEAKGKSSDSDSNGVGVAVSQRDPLTWRKALSNYHVWREQCVQHSSPYMVCLPSYQHAVPWICYHVRALKALYWSPEHRH